MTKLIKLYGSFFDVKPDEIKKTVLLQLYIFILITTLLVVKPSINSIFLSELGSGVLPLAYLFTALFALLFSVVYNRLTNRVAIKGLILGTLFISIGLLLLFSWILHQHPTHKQWLYVPYIFVAIYGLLTTSQFWLLSNLVFNVRQAKRLFGLIGSGAIAGGIFGGYLTSVLSKFIASEYLLVVSAGLLAICIPINSYLWKNLVPKARLGIKTERTKSKTPLRFISNNTLLKHMTLALAISVFVAKLVDYQFSHFATEKFQDTEALTAFFGFWFSTLSIISLAVQAGLTKRILAVAGLKYSLLMYPAGILISSVLLLFFPELWVVILLKVVDGSLKQSLNKASFELLSIPIPIDVKRNTKVFIDVVVDSIATGLAGIMLYLIIHKLNITTAQISFLTVALCLVWIVYVFKMHKDYIGLFRSILVGPEKKKAKKIHPSIDTSLDSFHNTAENILLHGEESQQVFILKKMLEHPDAFYKSALLNNLHHKAPKVKALVIKNFYFLDQTDISISLIKDLHYDTDEEVLLELFRYLVHKRSHLEIEQVNKAIGICLHPKAELIAELAMAMESEYNNELTEHLQLKNRLRKLAKNATAEEDLIYILPIIAYLRYHEYYYLLESGLNHKNINIKKAAIRSVGITRDLQFTELLLKTSTSKVFEGALIAAFNKFDEDLLMRLAEITINFELELPVLKQIPWIISHLHFEKRPEILVSIIEHAEYSIAINAIDAIHHLELSAEELKSIDSKILNRIIHECEIYKLMINGIHTQNKIKVEPQDTIEKAKEGLITLLDHRLDSQLKRIFKLIGVKYANAELHLILESSISSSLEERSNALEYLDNVLAYELRHLLFPILDFVVSENPYTATTLQKLQLNQLSIKDCFVQLIRLKDRRIKHAVLYLIAELKDRQFDPILDLLLKDEDPIIRAHTSNLKDRNDLV